MRGSERKFISRKSSTTMVDMEDAKFRDGKTVSYMVKRRIEDYGKRECTGENQDTDCKCP